MKGSTTGFMPNSIVAYNTYGTCASHPGSGMTTPEGCALHIGQQQASVQNTNNNKYAGGGSLCPGPYAGQAVVPQLETGVPTIGPNGPLQQAVVGNMTHAQGLENSKYDDLALSSTKTGAAYVFDQLPTVGGKKRRRTVRRRTKGRRTKGRKRTRYLRRKAKKSRKSRKHYKRSMRKRRVRRTHRKKK